MVGGPVGDLSKLLWRRFKRITRFKVDDAATALSGQDSRWNEIQKRQSAHERIIQSFGNFVPQSQHIDHDIVHECAWLSVGCIDPGLGRNRRPGLGGVVAKNAALG